MVIKPAAKRTVWLVQTSALGLRRQRTIAWATVSGDWVKNFGACFGVMPGVACRPPLRAETSKNSVVVVMGSTLETWMPCSCSSLRIAQHTWCWAALVAQYAP